MSRFIIKRTDVHKNVQSNVQLPKAETKSAIQKIKKAEAKTISKVRKRAKLEGVQFSEIHHQLTLYAIREHIKQMIKDLSENKYL